MKYTLLFLSFFISVAVQCQVITTIAGNDTAGFSGDGDPATAAKLKYPLHARPDAAGNIYIADVQNHRVRKVNALGIISTVAGNGGSYCCDGMPATGAGVTSPSTVAVDTAGNLYLSDMGSGPVIRKVNTAGIISNFAGGGIGGDGGPATAAALHGAADVAVDKRGNVYIVEPPGFIRKVDAAGIISTIAGNGISGYSGDGGPATLAQLDQPVAVAVDDSGNLYIADFNNRCVRKVDTGGIITTIAGNDTFGFSGDGGPATTAQLGGPTGVAVDGAGNVYIADQSNSRIRKVSAGIITTVAGDSTAGHTGDGGPATAAELYGPNGVAVDAAGNIYIADKVNHDVRKISALLLGAREASPSAAADMLCVYPNPNKESFTIRISGAVNEQAYIIITNAAGQKIKEFTMPANKETQVQLAAPPGMYFITAITKQGKYFSKVLVE